MIYMHIAHAFPYSFLVGQGTYPQNHSMYEFTDVHGYLISYLLVGRFCHQSGLTVIPLVRQNPVAFYVLYKSSPAESGTVIETLRGYAE